MGGNPSLELEAPSALRRRNGSWNWGGREGTLRWCLTPSQRSTCVVWRFGCGTNWHLTLTGDRGTQPTIDFTDSVENLTLLEGGEVSFRAFRFPALFLPVVGVSWSVAVTFPIGGSSRREGGVESLLWKEGSRGTCELRVVLLLLLCWSRALVVT